MAISKERQSLFGKMGGYVTASRYDSHAINAKARRVYRESFDQQARDEAAARGETITEAEAERRGLALYKLHFVRLSAIAARRRQENREAEALGPG